MSSSLETKDPVKEEAATEAASLRDEVDRDNLKLFFRMERWLRDREEAEEVGRGNLASGRLTTS